MIDGVRHRQGGLAPWLSLNASGSLEFAPEGLERDVVIVLHRPAGEIIERSRFSLPVRLLVLNGLIFVVVSHGTEEIDGMVVRLRILVVLWTSA